MLEARQGKLKAEDESQLDSYEKDAKLSDVPVDSKISLNDDVIIAQSMLFFLGGFDTVEGLLTFATYELGVNAGIQERLYQELKAAVDENDGEFSYDIVNSLEYLNMVISETLRLYSIGVRTERKCTKPYKVPGTDVILEKDMLLTISTYAIHHDPEYYPNPEKFDPLRFTKEKVSKRHPFAYQPFGHGPRNCIGNRFNSFSHNSELFSSNVLLLELFSFDCQYQKRRRRTIDLNASTDDGNVRRRCRAKVCIVKTKLKGFFSACSSQSLMGPNSSRSVQVM
ncbi:unnamed protein product [Allacma fusca]|uniref:Uncharacterized protein n=1 Tax=Allacma fusca TaxID=39272 RepID=A0A8J2PNJ1_9HEXA|nr:unnamed protein product [Allacma fusca]